MSVAEQGALSTRRADIKVMRIWDCERDKLVDVPNERAGATWLER
jgi:hypothetical protein